MCGKKMFKIYIIYVKKLKKQDLFWVCFRIRRRYKAMTMKQGLKRREKKCEIEIEIENLQCAFPI